MTFYTVNYHDYNHIIPILYPFLMCKSLLQGSKCTSPMAARPAVPRAWRNDTFVAWCTGCRAWRQLPGRGDLLKSRDFSP